MGDGGVFPGLESVGIPCAASSPAAVCQLISARQVEKLPEQRLRELLSGNIVIEGAAVAGLWARGLEKLIEGVRAIPAQRLEEYWTTDPLNVSLDVPMRRAYDRGFQFEIPSGVKHRILGYYRDLNNTAQGVSSVLLTRPDGSRIAALGCNLATGSISTAQIRFFQQICDWAAHETLPVLTEEPVRVLLVPRITSAGILHSVTLLNPTIGTQKPFALQLRNVPTQATRAQWLIPGEPEIELALKRNDTATRLMIPALAAWSIGWIRFC